MPIYAAPITAVYFYERGNVPIKKRIAYCIGNRITSQISSEMRSKNRSEQVQLSMAPMGVLFQLEAVFTPSRARLFAVKTHTLYCHFGAAGPALNSVKEFREFKCQYRSSLFLGS